jgi:hypothetical protein
MQMLPVAKLARPNKRAEFKFEHDLLARFDFGGSFGQCGCPSVSPAQQAKFQKDFKDQLERVQTELAGLKDRSDKEWLPIDAPLPPRLASGPYQPRTDFQVSVSQTYDKARALVPAWLGQRGWMEFPAHRVVTGDATIAHELIHVLFPNANRMLAEGLAVYLQFKLFPHIKAWPNFGDHLEALVEDFLTTNCPKSPSNGLWNLDLDGFERISSPDELTLRIGGNLFGAESGGSSPDDEKGVYAIAGSFVGFLLENLIQDDLLTVENFGSVYKSTPMRPLERDAGPPDRWQESYKGKGKSYSFAELGLLWKTYMHFILFRNDDIQIPKRYAKNPSVSDLWSRLNNHSARGPQSTK